MLASIKLYFKMWFHQNIFNCVEQVSRWPKISPFQIICITISINHLSYCDGGALTHFVYFNLRCHRIYYPECRSCTSYIWTQKWNLSVKMNIKSDEHLLVTMLPLCLASSFRKFWPINCLGIFFYSKSLLWKSAQLKMD